jgi:hypothetical protein
VYWEELILLLECCVLLIVIFYIYLIIFLNNIILDISAKGKPCWACMTDLPNIQIKNKLTRNLIDTYSDINFIPEGIYFILFVLINLLNKIQNIQQEEVWYLLLLLV